MERYYQTEILGDLTSVKTLGLSEEEIVKIEQILSVRDTLVLTPS